MEIRNGKRNSIVRQTSSPTQEQQQLLLRPDGFAAGKNTDGFLLLTYLGEVAGHDPRHVGGGGEGGGEEGGGGHQRACAGAGGSDGVPQREEDGGAAVEGGEEVAQHEEVAVEEEEVEEGEGGRLAAGGLRGGDRDRNI